MNTDRGKLLDGHLLTKEVGNKTKHVNLLNVVRPWHIMDLEESGLAEKTFPTSDEIAANEDKWENWDKVEKLQEQIRKNGGQFIVYEHWTEDEFEIAGKTKQTKGCIKYLDCRALQETDSKEVVDWEPYMELERFASPDTRKITSKVELKGLKKRGIIGPKEDRVPCYPYKERRMFTLEGRALGVGVWELLSSLIKHYNENWNNKRRFDQLANRGLLILKKGQNEEGDSLTQEFINQADRGAVLEIEHDEDLRRFDLGNITVDHLATVDKLFDLARQTLGITSSLIQEQKASQSATAAALENQNAKTTYATVIEEMSLYYQELFRDFKLPIMIDELKEHKMIKLMGSDDELAEVEEMFIQNLINSKIPDAPVLFSSSRLPEDEEEKIKEAIKTVRKKDGSIRFAELKKSLFKFFEFDIEFYVNNEIFDQRTAASGTKIATFKASVGEGTYSFNVKFKTGLTIVTAAASNITVNFN
jgi:hypothetical protein